MHIKSNLFMISTALIINTNKIQNYETVTFYSMYIEFLSTVYLAMRSV